MKLVRLSRYTMLTLSMLIFTFSSLFCDYLYGVPFSKVLIPFCLMIVGFLLNKCSLQLRGEHVYAIIFWIMCSLSTLLSPSVEMQRDLITFLCFVVTFVIFTGTQFPYKTLRLLLFCYIGIAICGSVMIIWNWANGIYYDAWIKRASVSFKGVVRDTNYVAGFIAPAAIVIWHMLLNEKTKRVNVKAIAIGAILLIIFAIILDSSRGALLSILVAFSVSFLLRKEKASRKIGIVVLVIIVMIVALPVIGDLLPAQSVARYTGIFASGYNRIPFWRAGLQPFLNNPLIGEGLGSSNIYAVKIAGNHSHNMYIDVLSASGVLGFCIFIGMVVCTSFKHTSKARDMVSILIAFFLPLFFTNGLTTMSFWLPMIMIYFVREYLAASAQNITEIGE